MYIATQTHINLLICIQWNRMSAGSPYMTCNSQQQETGLAASPYMCYVIVYPVRNA